MSYSAALTHHLQRMVMADRDLTWDDVQLDEDGEICFLDEHDRLIRVVALDLDGETWARVWVVAAFGVKTSAKLLREVNELNLSLLGARAMVTPGGWLVLTGEVELASVEPGELGRLIERLTESAERSGPMIQMMYGAGGVRREPREAEP